MSNLIIITAKNINELGLFKNESQIDVCNINKELQEYWNEKLNKSKFEDFKNDFLKKYHIKDTDIWGYKCHPEGINPVNKTDYFYNLISEHVIKENVQIWLFVHDKEIIKENTRNEFFLPSSHDLIVGLKDKFNLNKPPIIYGFIHKTGSDNPFYTTIKTFDRSKFNGSAKSIEDHLLDRLIRQRLIKQFYKYFETILITYYPNYWNAENVVIKGSENQEWQKLFNEISTYFNDKQTIIEKINNVNNLMKCEIDIRMLRESINGILLEFNK